MMPHGATPIAASFPGRELEKMVARRGPKWWHDRHRAAAPGSPCSNIDESIAGYASYGRNRVPTLPYGGEIFELYLAPEFQGLGFGRRLFDAARRDLANHGYTSTLVWALADNERALSFYGHLGGRDRPPARRSGSAPKCAAASPSASTERLRPRPIALGTMALPPVQAHLRAELVIRAQSSALRPEHGHEPRSRLDRQKPAR